MSEPVEVFPGDLSGDAVDRDAMLGDSTSEHQVFGDILCRDTELPLTFLQVSTVLRGVCEQSFASAEAWPVP